MTCADGRSLAKAMASAPDPVHRSTITGRSGKGWASAHSSIDSVSGRGMNTPGPTETVTGPNGAFPVRCCSGLRAAREAISS